MEFQLTLGLNSTIEICGIHSKRQCWRLVWMDPNQVDSITCMKDTTENEIQLDTSWILFRKSFLKTRKRYSFGRNANGVLCFRPLNSVYSELRANLKFGQEYTYYSNIHHESDGIEMV